MKIAFPALLVLLLSYYGARWISPRTPACNPDAANLVLETLIETYGYIAVAAGSLLEGEASVLLGGIAAKLGHLQLKGVILAAIVGTVIGDLAYFFIGRRYGKGFLAKRPAWRERVDRVDRLLMRWDIAFVFGFRFIYGLRSVAAFALGASSIDARKFIALNAIAVLFWSLIFSYSGYLFGHAAEQLLAAVEGKSSLVILLLVGAAAAIGILFSLRARMAPANAR